MATDIEQTEEDIITREYECGYLLLPTIAQENVESEEGQLQKIVQDGGGTIANTQSPRRFPLAYTMSISREGSRDRYTEAYFGWITFEANSQQVNDIKEALRTNESLLRYMVVKADKDQEPESLIEEEELADDAADTQDGEETTTETGADKEVSEKELEKSIEGIVDDTGEETTS